MSYLSAKDELVSLTRFSSRGLWKWYNSKVLDRRLYGAGQHFTCCRFSRKRKFFGNFNCDFQKFSPKGFSDYMNMKSFEIPVLTENSQHLQTAALKFLAKRLLSLSPRLNDYSICNIDTSCPCKAYTTLRLWNMGTRTTVKKTHFDKSTIEQVHIKFCKQVLNVPWYSENIAWKAELGRYHLSIDIKASLLCHWQRLEQKSDTTAISTVRTFMKIINIFHRNC